MKFHDTLNPKLWNLHKDSTYSLKEEVADKLKQIADAFIDALEIPEDAILDQVITGSSASYNYTEYSDIDLHIKVDFDKVHEDCPIVKGYLNAIKTNFNKEHDVTIYGIPVELYAEGASEDTVHNGLYSLNTGWIDIPKRIPPTDNDAAVLAKYNEIKEQIEQVEDSELATELLSKVYEMRKSGLAEAGEFSTENLAFKKLRDDGLLNKLRELKRANIDKQLSLETKKAKAAEDLDQEAISAKYLESGKKYKLKSSASYCISDFSSEEFAKLQPYIATNPSGFFILKPSTQLIFKGKDTEYDSYYLEVEDTGIILDFDSFDKFYSVDATPLDKPTSTCIILDNDYNWVKDCGEFTSAQAAQTYLDKHCPDGWMYSECTRRDLIDLGIEKPSSYTLFREEYKSESVNADLVKGIDSDVLSILGYSTFM